MHPLHFYVCHSCHITAVHMHVLPNSTPLVRLHCLLLGQLCSLAYAPNSQLCQKLYRAKQSVKVARAQHVCAAVAVANGTSPQRAHFDTTDTIRSGICNLLTIIQVKTFLARQKALSSSLQVGGSSQTPPGNQLDHRTPCRPS